MQKQLPSSMKWHSSKYHPLRIEGTKETRFSVDGSIEDTESQSRCPGPTMLYAVQVGTREHTLMLKKKCGLSSGFADLLPNFDQPVISNFMRCFYLLFLCIGAICLHSCSPEMPEDVAAAYKALPHRLDYNLHVKPILSDKCFACHGPDGGKRKAELRLDLPEAAFASLPETPGKVAIDPGNANGSEVYHRILSSDPEYMMPDPESHHVLSSREKAVLIRWIEEGANYKPHWALVKPELPDVPKARKNERIANPIDNFILQKLHQEKLQASPDAEKELLLRRVTLDLTGLPPTLDEIQNFLQDNAADAYEKQVDRLLRSPHYGEKMAVDWLDVARFADSHGYTVDRLRDMSPYRDWVIKAFNENLPYDDFIHWQLGGDLMPNATKEMIIATAFNRNHQQNMEGGIVEQEFQTEYVVDRTNTFGDAFLGLSVGCARCHDHKFDPVSQKNYYELFSFFNNVREAGQISWDDALPTPTLMLATEDQEKTIRFIETTIAEQEKKIRQLKGSAAADFEKWTRTTGYKRLSKEQIPRTGLVGKYDFDDGSLKNTVDPRQRGIMKRLSGEEMPRFIANDAGNALTFNGDVWLDLNPVGVFRRTETFTIGIWVNIPKALNEGVIFHKGIAERLYNFRGYHLYLKNNRLELNMAHTAPSNAITKITKDNIPRDTWIQLTVTYDGSSQASGLRVYLNGSEMPTETLMDQLTKDILFHSATQPGLQVGAWDRGFGFKGGSADDIVVYDRVLTDFEIKILARQTAWRDVMQEGTHLSPTALHALKEYYVSAVDPQIQRASDELKVTRTALADSVESIKELMVMQEMPERRKTYVLDRGSYDAPAEEVFPNTPASILAFPKSFPRTRYGLAQWLTHPDHPLTARVAVNRFWQNFFGTGLVKTSEDFGNQGELPSHPELLDWLAIAFIQSGWDVKALNKLIVMSATYRQDSKVTPAAYEMDPENRLLARGPAFRLSAEMIRDNALAASGLLNKTIGGESVKPYQPEGLWSINNATYVPDTGSAVYRRSLYVLIKRTVPNPTLSTFDATSRSYCVVRRQKTNTPLQALVTLNDPTFVEVARALGAQMAESPDLRQAIRATFKKLTGRGPSEKETDLLVELQRSQLMKFKQHPGKAKGWLDAGQYPVDKDLDPLLIAANAVVASTILNGDATLTRR